MILWCVGGQDNQIFFLAGIYTEVEKIRQLINVEIKENGGREQNQCLVQESIITELSSFNLTGLLYR